MKIKLDSINQEITFQQASDLYNELKELFEPRANFSPPFFPDPPWIRPDPYLYDPLRVKYGATDCIGEVI